MVVPVVASSSEEIIGELDPNTGMIYTNELGGGQIIGKKAIAMFDLIREQGILYTRSTTNELLCRTAGGQISSITPLTPAERAMYMAEPTAPAESQHIITGNIINSPVSTHTNPNNHMEFHKSCPVVYNFLSIILYKLYKICCVFLLQAGNQPTSHQTTVENAAVQQQPQQPPAKVRHNHTIMESGIHCCVARCRFMLLKAEV